MMEPESTIFQRVKFALFGIDNYEEQEIIKKYVRKNNQDRILWELSTPRKRNVVFWNFSGSDVFNENCLHPIFH